MTAPDQGLRQKFQDGYLGLGSLLTGCHKKRPFSWKKPSKELQPGPPFNQIVISSVGFPIVG